MGKAANRRKRRLDQDRGQDSSGATTAATAPKATRSKTRKSTRSPGRRSTRSSGLGINNRRRIVPANSTAFGYDAIRDKKRRRPPQTSTRSEDETLGAANRKKLVATTRDLRRNFSIAAWAIRKHLDYCSRFTFQSRTGNDALDQKIERLIAWYSRKENCDVAGRHPLPRFLRLAEQARTLDGDVFLMKLSSGRLQAIEGDRVRFPDHKAPAGMKRDAWTHGVKTSAAGRPRKYSICKRKPGGGGYEFERAIPAKHIITHGYFDRFDQVRGISPMAAAINCYQDIYEAATYALAKAKVAQLFGLVISRDAPEALAPITQVTSNDAEGEDNEPDVVNEKYDIDFGSGPAKLELEPGDDAKIIGENTPSPAFAEFCQAMIAVALKALDIPYSFYDASSANYYAGRGDLIQYLFSCETKRADNVETLNAITKWRLGLFILDGEITEAEAEVLDLESEKWDWIPAGVPWWNPLQEVKADVLAIENGLSTRTKILRAQGLDFREVADELDSEEQYLAKLLAARQPTPTPPTGDDQVDDSKGASDGES